MSSRWRTNGMRRVVVGPFLKEGVLGFLRVIHVKVDIDAEGVIRAVVGRGAAANAVARPDVVVLWAPAPDGFSLIADGTASVDGEPRPDMPITIEVFSAVRHRPAPR